MGRVNEKCFWYCKDYTQCTDKDWVPRHWCELRGELNVEPNYYICNYCKRFIDKEDMKEKLENKRKREEQNKDKLGIKVKVKKVKQEDLKTLPDYIIKTVEPFYSHWEYVNSNSTEGGIVCICNKCSNAVHKPTSTCSHCGAIMLEKYNTDFLASYWIYKETKGGAEDGYYECKHCSTKVS